MTLKVDLSTLPNGVRVITSSMPHVESVAVGIWAGVGGRYESLRNNGLSHFIEHLLFKGTPKRDAREISEAIEGRGGYFNAFTQEESTCYYARITRDFLPEIVDILSDMYLRPRFREEDIDLERGVIIEEIMMYRDQPHQHVQDMLGELLWAGHPLGRPLVGTPRNIERANRAEIQRFKALKYVPGNTVVALAGAVSHEEGRRQAARAFRPFRPRPRPGFRSVTSRTRQIPVSVLSRPIEQTQLAMGVRLFGRRDARRFALKLLSVILGENMSSRLFQVVRERHGLAYHIQSSVQLFEDTGVMDISAGLDRERVSQALKLVAGELARLRRTRVGAAELRRAKDYAVGQLRIGMESSVNQMIWLGENLLAYGHFTQPDDIVKQLHRVTAEDIRRLAQTAFHPRRISTALIAPEDSGDLGQDVQKQIRRVGDA